MDTACLPERSRYVYVLYLETILHALNFKLNYSKLFCSCSFTAMWIHSFPLSFNVFICLFLGPTCTKCLRYGICISCFIPQVNKELTPKFVFHSFLLPSERGIHTENQGMQRLDQVSVSFAKLCIVFPEQQPSACFPHRVCWILRLFSAQLHWGLAGSEKWITSSSSFSKGLLVFWCLFATNIECVIFCTCVPVFLWISYNVLSVCEIKLKMQFIGVKQRLTKTCEVYSSYWTVMPNSKACPIFFGTFVLIQSKPFIFMQLVPSSSFFSRAKKEFCTGFFDVFLCFLIFDIRILKRDVSLTLTGQMMEWTFFLSANITHSLHLKAETVGNEMLCFNHANYET